MHKYTKHPMYVGKNLTIQRGRQDKHVKDGEVLEGREWEKFVAQGLLIPMESKEEPKPAPLPKTPKVPIKAKSETRIDDTEKTVMEVPKPSRSDDDSRVVEVMKKDEGSVSKSPASKVSGVGGKKTKASKKSKK